MDYKSVGRSDVKRRVSKGEAARKSCLPRTGRIGVFLRFRLPALQPYEGT